MFWEDELVLIFFFFLLVEIFRLKPDFRNIKSKIII